jgi:hypothetical protein
MDTLSLDNSQAKLKKVKHARFESRNDSKKKKVSILTHNKFTD